MLGPKFHQRLKQQMSGLPGVAEVRGIGLWYAMEFVDRNGTADSKSASKLIRELRQQGVVVGGGGYAGNAIKIAPALNIDEEELSQGIDTVIAAVKSWSAARA